MNSFTRIFCSIFVLMFSMATFSEENLQSSDPLDKVIEWLKIPKIFETKRQSNLNNLRETISRQKFSQSELKRIAPFVEQANTLIDYQYHWRFIEADVRAIFFAHLTEEEFNWLARFIEGDVYEEQAIIKKRGIISIIKNKVNPDIALYLKSRIVETKPQLDLTVARIVFIDDEKLKKAK